MALSALHAEDGGPPRAVLKLSEALAKAGDDVELLALRIPNVALDSAYAEAVAAGVKITFVPTKRLGKFRYSLSYLIKLRKMSRASEVVVAHGFYQWTCIAAWLGVIGRSRIRLVIQPHGVFEPYQESRGSRLKPIFMRIVGRRILSRAHAMVGTSQQEIDGFQISLYGVPLRPALVPLGVDIPRSREFDENRYESMRVLFLSRIAPKKRLDILLNAVDLMIDQGTPVQLTVCGDGDSTFVSNLKGTVRNSTAVHWAGHVEGSSRVAIEQSHALFCLPTDNENFGQVITESMAAGLPVVTTVNAGASSFVVDADSGWVLESATPALLAQTLTAALSAPGNLRSMAERGIKYCETELGWMAVATQWQQLGRGQAPQLQLTANSVAMRQDA